MTDADRPRKHETRFRDSSGGVRPATGARARTAPDPDGMAAQPGAATEAVAPVSSPLPGAPKRRRHEFLYFAVRNKKLLVGISVVGSSSSSRSSAHGSPATRRSRRATPLASAFGRHWLGTTYFDEDVFSQVVYGIRASFEVGVLGGCFSVLLGCWSASPPATGVAGWTRY